MKTDIIRVCGEESHMAEVLSQVDKTIIYKGLSGKNALHLHLLSEEMLALMHAITGHAEGEFWIEENKGVYELHLSVEAMLDEKRREQLLSASTSGKNEAAKGFMGKIRTFFEPAGGIPAFSGGFMPGSSAQVYSSMIWSLENYKVQLKLYKEQNRTSAEEWDELEKSVVAHLADDVKVSIKQHTVEMIIIKKIA